MEPSDVWSFEFESEEKAKAAAQAIAGQFGAIAELGAEGPTMLVGQAPQIEAGTKVSEKVVPTTAEKKPKA